MRVGYEKYTAFTVGGKVRIGGGARRGIDCDSPCTVAHGGLSGTFNWVRTAVKNVDRDAETGAIGDIVADPWPGMRNTELMLESGAYSTEEGRVLIEKEIPDSSTSS